MVFHIAVGEGLDYADCKHGVCGRTDVGRKWFFHGVGGDDVMVYFRAEMGASDSGEGWRFHEKMAWVEFGGFETVYFGKYGIVLFWLKLHFAGFQCM